MFCVSSLDVNHYFEPSRVSFVFQFVFQMRRTIDYAPRSPIFSASRRPPPTVPSESPLRAIAQDDGSVTPMLSPRSTFIVTADLERCSRVAAQVNKDLALYSASEDENEWDPTGKSIEEIRAFLKKWERECRNSNYARIAKENAAYKKQRREKLTVRLAKKGRVYHSDEDDGAFCYDTDFQEDIWEDEGHEEETREFYARARVPGDNIYNMLLV